MEQQRTSLVPEATSVTVDWEQAVAARIRQRQDQLLQLGAHLASLAGENQANEKIFTDVLREIGELSRSAERFVKVWETFAAEEQHLLTEVLPSLETTVSHLRERFASERTEIEFLEEQRIKEKELHALCFQAERLAPCSVLEQQLVERRDELAAVLGRCLQQKQRLRDLHETLERLQHVSVGMGAILGVDTNRTEAANQRNGNGSPSEEDETQALV